MKAELVELPPQCLEWGRFAGRNPLDIVSERPDQWIAVYDLRPLEFIAGLLYPNRRTVHSALAMMYHTGSQRFLAYPLWMMPEPVRSDIARPWADLWTWLLVGLFFTPGRLANRGVRTVQRFGRSLRRGYIKMSIHAELQYLELKQLL